MRIGIDLGGTKIEVIALDDDGAELLRERRDTPRSDYDDIVSAIAGLVTSAELRLGRTGSVGIAIPGTISTKTGLVKNANSTRLIGHPLDEDLAAVLRRPVRIANDANCFALSEAVDGAAMGCDVVFGVIAGTGVGGGVCVRGHVISGAHGIAGEWGHNPLPAPRADEALHAPHCYCGRRGCIETWISGPALQNQFEWRCGKRLAGTEIAELAAAGVTEAREVMEPFFDRFARALAGVVNILDPDAIVMGGGLSRIDALYTELPARIASYAFTPEAPTRVVRNVHGDSSGVRGAAWLWND